MQVQTITNGQLTKTEAGEFLAMARQVTALPNSLSLQQARRFRNLAIHHAMANPEEPMAQLWADRATLLCAEKLETPSNRPQPEPVIEPTVEPGPTIDQREPAAPVIDLTEPAAPIIGLTEPAPAPEAPAQPVSASYSDEVLLAAILHNDNG